MLSVVVLAAIVVCASGRAVNISNTWLLPEEGFPVFYRYFRDRISWYEADAVCQFHHANLVTVDTASQYDAVRSYLKQMDISNNVWVGLIKSNADGEFTWTDYRGLSGDGYWSSAPEEGVVPLCAMSDPASDYRWTAKGCGGPDVASFICELPVPQWAVGPSGCMVKIPGVVASFVPESAAVQLIEHCKDGTIHKLLCTGDKKHEHILSELQCQERDAQDNVESSEHSTTSEVITENPNNSDITTQTDVQDTSMTENISSKEAKTIDESLTTTSNDDVTIQTEKLSQFDIKNETTPIIIPLFGGNVINIMDDNNIENNIAKHEIQDPLSSKVIFTQSNDHFIPPLVMAKARLSEDLEVISAQRKLEQEKNHHHVVGKLGVGFEPYTSSTAPTDLLKEEQTITIVTKKPEHTVINSLLTSTTVNVETTVTSEITTATPVPKLAKPKKTKKFIVELKAVKPKQEIKLHNFSATTTTEQSQTSPSLRTTETQSTSEAPATATNINDHEGDISEISTSDEDSKLELHVIIKDKPVEVNSTETTLHEVSTNNIKSDKLEQTEDHTETSKYKNKSPLYSSNVDPEIKRKHDRRIQLSENKHVFNPFRILG